MSDDRVTDTDLNPDGPHGVGESVTRQGNTLAEADAEQPDGGDRDAAKASARDEDRERNRLQGSVDPQRPGPEPAD